MSIARPKAGRDHPRAWSEFLKLSRARGPDLHLSALRVFNPEYWEMGDGRRRCKARRGDDSHSRDDLSWEALRRPRLVRSDLACREHQERRLSGDQIKRSGYLAIPTIELLRLNFGLPLATCGD